jgi:phosphopantetheine--protein transferase-like protein
MIGTDIVHIPRFVRSVEGDVGKALLARMFSDDELDQCRRADGSLRMDSLAGRFAIKESVIKASQNELNLGDLSRIRILRHSSGSLHVEIEGEGVLCRRYEVSLSHDQDYATAVALRCLS